MIKKLNIKILILLTSIIIVGGYFFISSLIGNPKFSNLISLLINDEQKELIKKYIFPYKTISQQQQTISKLDENVILKFILLEVENKENGKPIETYKKRIKLINNKTLDKYKLVSNFYAGMNNGFPGSGYLDFYDDNIIILSSRGVLAFKKNIEEITENFQQIKNNINEFIGIKQFKKNRQNSIKDLHISNNKVFISYVNEIKENCFNISVIYGDIDYKNIIFKKLFSPEQCIDNKKNLENEYSSAQSGGRIISFGENYILVTTGEFRNRFLSQDIKSIFGKIIKVNIDNGNYEIISMGHRNPQGLLFDKENNFILETEHGPKGGDEINLIKIDKMNKNKIQNYGWPMASYGEHYGSTEDIKTKKKYEKYPLYKSHSEHGFIEPLKSFVPSIAISEIVKIGQNKYVVSSMGRNRSGDKSLYFFELNNEKKIINLEQIKVFERVRDLKFKDNKLYLFMEETSSIGVINLN